MKKTLFVASLLVMFPLLASAHGHSWHSNGHNHWKHEKPNPTTPPKPPVVPPVSNSPTTPPQTTPSTPSLGEIVFAAYTTGYSWYDNTPAGSAEISNPVIHSVAGGTGTYSDPITLAVGHTISNGKDTLDYPAGTRFYIPTLKRYFIVEDTCGDGSSPQNGPCHIGYQGHPWIDIYIGKGASKAASDACMNKITEVHSVIQNPKDGYAIVPGDIASNCAQY